MAENAKYKLDLGDERLWRGDQPIPLGNKAFDLLRLFVSNPNRLLTKDEILDSVWGDICVSDGLVKEYVYDLRQALGDDPQHPQFIETVRGRGYRFLGGVEALQPLADAEPLRPLGKPSIAILPFTNLSADPEQEYFADGLSEEITTALSLLPYLFVIARNSAFIYKGLSIDVRKVGEELGVRYLLEGSVRRAGRRVRVHGQLIDTDTATHIWAERYESRLDDVFDLQDEITEAVVNAIGPKIQLAEIERAARKRPHNLSAYDLYLKARAALNNVQIAAALELLDEAIANAPDYAKAKAVRAWCTTLFGWHYIAPSKAQRETAIRLAEEALASPEADAETQAYAGYTIGFMGNQKERAIALVEDVTRQCPSFAWAWASLALLESYYGDPRRAIELAEIALRLSPRDPQSFRCEMAICGAFVALHQFEDSLAFADCGLRKSPSNSFFQMARITSLVRLDRLTEAKVEAKVFIVAHPAFRISKYRAFTRNFFSWISIPPILEESLRAAGLPE